MKGGAGSLSLRRPSVFNVSICLSYQIAVIDRPRSERLKLMRIEIRSLQLGSGII